jgi:uncharacterized membrane protein
MVGARDDRRTARVTAIAFAASYLLSYYSSEARGYCPVACMVVFAWYCLQRYLDACNWRFAMGFWICSALGVMSHPAYIQFFIGAFVWCDAHSQRTQLSLHTATRTTALAFIPATVLIGVFYIVSLRAVTVGGGPPYVLTRVLAQTLSAIGGGPLGGGYMWAVALAVAAVFASSILDAHRRNDDRWLLYLNVGIVIPAIFVGFYRPPVLMPRYFLIPIVVALMSMSVFVARLHVTEAKYPREGTNWLIRESLSAAPGDASYRDKYGHVYTLQADYYASGLVGTTTFHLYRHAVRRAR